MATLHLLRQNVRSVHSKWLWPRGSRHHCSRDCDICGMLRLSGLGLAGLNITRTNLNYVIHPYATHYAKRPCRTLTVDLL